MTGPSRTIRREDFRLLVDLVNAYAGLHFELDAMPSFARRLGERLDALELGGFDEYYRYLRFNPRGAQELDEAVDRLTTHETYFFRQEYQLRAFEQELLPRLARANEGRRRLTVWSAGCSTGEEVYSLAVGILRSGFFGGWEVRVVGSDVSKRSIATARRATYARASFRVTSEDTKLAYFTQEADGLRVVEPVRRLCHFGQLNLLDADKSAWVGRADAIFCRNVLIYLDEASRRRVIDNLYERLAPGGFLLLGHSESLINVSTAFELEHLQEDLVYRKPALADAPEPGHARGSK